MAKKKSFQGGVLGEEARQAMRAVVRIHAKGFSEGNVQSLLDPRFLMPEEWVGSGFFIRSSEFKKGTKDLYIVTNGHVVRNAFHLEMRSLLTSDEPFELELVGVVEGLEPDVGLLKLKKGEEGRFREVAGLSRIPWLPFADSRKVVRGTEVKAIGYPLGMEEPHVSGGEISNFVAGTSDSVERLVTDAAINPGNSGGPAVIKGPRVVGINTSIVYGANNVGFITPAHLIRNMLGTLSEGKWAGATALGADIQVNSKANAEYLKQEKVEGVILRRVDRGGLAFRAGLRARDVLLEVNGIRLDRHGIVQSKRLGKGRKRTVYDLIHDVPLGSQLQLRYWRQGKELEGLVSARPWEGRGFPRRPILRNRTYLCFGGMVIQEISLDLVEILSSAFGYDAGLALELWKSTGSSLLVTHICEDSDSDDLGVEIGDLVTSVQGVRVKSFEDFCREIRRALGSRSKSKILVEFASGALGVFDRKSLNVKDCEIMKVGQK